jgi:NAD(P)-dependent dehydrogenase (short-subunit alcohol dehydrogenase family)
LNAAKSLGGSIRYLIWDVSNTALAHKQIQKAAEILGGIDILVNNAGAYSNVPFSSVNEKIWNTIMDTNIKGVFFICQAAAHQMIHNTNGAKIINITSIRGFEGDCTPYGISKWGANGFTKGLAREFISKNVIVNGIAPGITATEINGIDVKENAYCGYEPKNNRVALPEEIAEIALFLASDAANNIVGQTIICDGGSTLV